MKIKYIISTILAALLVFSCSSQSNNGATEKGKTIDVSVNQLKQAIDQKEDIVLLDVRTPQEVQEAHIEKSVHININQSDFKEEAAKLDKDKTVYVYCKMGGRSARASDILVNMGFKDVRNVKGGIADWKSNNYPVVH